MSEFQHLRKFLTLDEPYTRLPEFGPAAIELAKDITERVSRARRRLQMEEEEKKKEEAKRMKQKLAERRARRLARLKEANKNRGVVGRPEWICDQLAREYNWDG